MSLCRYELKFLIDAQAKKQILERLEPGLFADPHGVGGSYRITSLYYDTPDLTAFWEKLDGHAVRHKVRLRYYGDEPTRPFLEVKTRYYQQVLKRRLPLEREVGEACLNLDRSLTGIPFQAQGPKQEEAFFMVQKAATSSSLQGTVVVSYVREAWIGRVDPSLRVTFDHLCQAHAPSCHMASATHSGLPFLPETQIVFELKYDRRVPLWVRDQIRACSVRPVRISKYAEGLIRHFQERKLQIC